MTPPQPPFAEEGQSPWLGNLNRKYPGLGALARVAQVASR